MENIITPENLALWGIQKEIDRRDPTLCKRDPLGYSDAVGREYSATGSQRISAISRIKSMYSLDEYVSRAVDFYLDRHRKAISDKVRRGNDEAVFNMLRLFCCGNKGMVKKYYRKYWRGKKGF